jgi:aminopeptidase N
MRDIRQMAWIAAAAAALFSAAPALAEDVPGAGFDVTRYTLALTPDMASAALSGRETIAFRVTEAGLDRLVFTGNALTIDSARLDGKALVPVQRGKALVFELGKPLPRGRRGKLELTYHGRPARGFARSAEALYTSYFACDWMVCAQDRFGDKAAFSLDLSVPKGMDTLSVGRRVAKRAGQDGREFHRWRAARLYPAYLYGFAVGRFAEVRSGKLAFLSDVADPAELQRRFAETGDMARFFAAKAGLPLPAGEYTQLLVRGDEAQEAATYAVLGLDAMPGEPGDPAEDWAIAHELAHQWWGNLVTCTALREFWLNEGVTTFMTAAWKEHRYGRAAYEAELGAARQRLQGAREQRFDKPLAWGGTYPSLGARRAVQYSKGALFMDRLRGELGEAAFWSGLRRYTRGHAGGTVTSLDLQQAMEAASGRDLRALFAEWVFGSDDGAEKG